MVGHEALFQGARDEHSAGNGEHQEKDRGGNVTINSAQLIDNGFEFHNLEAVFQMTQAELSQWLIMASAKMFRDLQRTREELGWEAYYKKAELWREAIRFAREQIKSLFPMCHLLN